MMDDELQKKIDDGKIVLGGCCVTFDDPRWECAECRQQYKIKTDIDLKL